MIDIRSKLPASVIEHIWTILEETCGAPKHWRDQFVAMHQQDPYPKEYRFIGKLGFGGKFWRTNGKFYVNCYPEDETEARLKIVAEANERLAALLSSI